MKLALVFLAMLPLVLSGPVEEKRFLEFLHLDGLVNQLKDLVYPGTPHVICVGICQKIAGLLSYLCDAACNKLLEGETNTIQQCHQCDLSLDLYVMQI